MQIIAERSSSFDTGVVLFENLDSAIAMVEELDGKKIFGRNKTVVFCPFIFHEFSKKIFYTVPDGKNWSIPTILTTRSPPISNKNKTYSRSQPVSKEASK